VQSPDPDEPNGARLGMVTGVRALG
jgi:hypothetical protein